MMAPVDLVTVLRSRRKLQSQNKTVAVLQCCDATLAVYAGVSAQDDAGVRALQLTRALTQ